MQVGRRTVAGALVAGAVAAAGLLVAPDRALAALATLAERPVAFAAVLAGVYLLRPFLAWPPVAVAAAVGAILGPAVGLPVALAGTVGSSLVPYALGEWFATDDGVVGRMADGGRAYFDHAGDVRGLTAARLAPLPADGVSVAAGLAGLAPGPFIVGTLLGELPWTVAAVVVGASARTVATAGLGGLSTPLLVATTLAALALLAGPAYRALGGAEPA